LLIAGTHQNPAAEGTDSHISNRSVLFPAVEQAFWRLMRQSKARRTYLVPIRDQKNPESTCPLLMAKLI